MLAKNSKTFLLSTVSPFSDDYLDTVNTLRITTRALSITTTCGRILNVHPSEISWKSLDEIIPVLDTDKLTAIKHKPIEKKDLQPTTEFLDDIGPMNADKDPRLKRYIIIHR